MVQRTHALHCIFMRAAMLLLMLYTTAVAQAVEYITDVMLIGAPTESELNSLKETYSAQGWKIINYDLNKGIPWGKGDGILLLYKSEESPDGCNHNYITDFYIQNRGADNTTETLEYDGRTYTLVPYDGSDHFKGQKGDLNSGTGANTAAIHLYYTRQELPTKRAVTYINLNDTQKGALGKEGSNTGYDLNTGCSELTNQKVYFHFLASSTAEPDYFITDVMVLYAWSKDNINKWKDKYEHEGWTFIDYDLHKGIPAGVAPWVYLIYKKAHRKDIYNNYITDLFASEKFQNRRPEFNGVIYKVVPWEADGSFMGDLNTELPGERWLYYTKSFLPAETERHAVNNIFVDDNPNCALNDLDLNPNGIDSPAGIATVEPVYLHVSRALVYDHLKPASNLDLVETTETGIRVKGWAYDPDKSNESVPVRIEVKRINGSAYKTVNLMADLQYDAVNSTYKITGNHGFDTTVPIEDAGTYSVNVFAGDLTNDGEVQVGSTTTLTFIGSSPISSLETYVTQEKGFQIRGWAYDPDCPDESIPVRVEVIHADSITYKTETINANILRTDVNTANGITGNHGFEAIISVPKAGSYIIKIYACDLTKNTDTQIGGTQTLKVVGSKPMSSLDVCESSNGGIRIKGWAFDPDDSDKKIPIRVEIKHTDGSEYMTKNLTTDDDRSDVNTANGITGSHGFSVFIPVSAGTYNVCVYASDLTDDGDVQVGSTIPLICNGIIVLTEETDEITLMDGNSVMGMGGDNTRIIIAADATVTLNGINITSPMSKGDKIYDQDEDYLNNTDRQWSGITCLGNATIILADGTNNYVQGGGSRYSGIQPGPTGSTLTIRGNGELEARGWPHGAGIGSINAGDCGNIVIEGGTIKAYSYSTRYRMFNGKPTLVTSLGFGAAIGTGAAGTCGDIIIKGGIIFAETAKATAAIGCGNGGNCGNIIFGNSGIRIYAKVIEDNSPYNTIGIAPGNDYATSSCGTLTIGGVQTDYITDNPWSYTPVDNNHTYSVSFDANGGSGSMNSQGFVYNVPQALNACTFTLTGYHFTGWNTMADGSGLNYTDQQEINLLTSPKANITLFAQWELDIYSITYVNAVNGTENIVNTNPLSYTYITDTINLLPPTKFGYEFVGWTWEGQTTPNISATIPKGSLDAKTFTAHWSPINDLVLTENVGAFTMQDGQSITGTGGANTHISIADGATVTLKGVDIRTITDDNKHWWAGITCNGSATIILADGTTNYLKGGYTQRPGIFIRKNHTLTIKGSGKLIATGSGYDGPGIGGNYETTCGNIVIEDGIIIATGTRYAPGIGNKTKEVCGDITIKGGTVTAVGGFRSPGIGAGENSTCGKITITNGITSVTATKEDESDIIGAGYLGTCGNINISCNLIDASSRNTRTLWGLALVDDNDNTDAINVKKCCSTDVQLRGRTLYKDGDWHTICLPFNVTLKDSPLEGATVKKLDNDNSSLDRDILTLNFKDENETLQAGTPYIIRWDKGDNLVNPIFRGVTISDATTNAQTFAGGKFIATYSPVGITADDQSVLYLGAENKLYYPTDNMNINSCSAYFKLDNNTLLRKIWLNFEKEDVENGIISTFNVQSADAIYDLSGRKVNSRLSKGIYIKNGKKVAIK